MVSSVHQTHFHQSQCHLESYVCHQERGSVSLDPNKISRNLYDPSERTCSSSPITIFNEAELLIDCAFMFKDFYRFNELINSPENVVVDSI